MADINGGELLDRIYARLDKKETWTKAEAKQVFRDAVLELAYNEAEMSDGERKLWIR